MDLTEIGLTKNESKVFEKLVELGKSGAAKISKESEVSYSRIYNVLASLEHKGLVKIIPEKGKKFVPGDPEVLRKLIEEKRKSLQKLDKDVDRLKKFYNVKEKEPVEIAKGKKNFYKILREMRDPKTLEYAIKYTAEFFPEGVRRTKKFIHKKIDVKTLTRYNKETKNNVHKWLKIEKEIKKIPNHGVALNIRDEQVMISLIKSNIQLIIRDRPFIELMKELFRKYYENAEKIQSTNLSI